MSGRGVPVMDVDDCKHVFLYAKAFTVQTGAVTMAIDDKAFSVDRCGPDAVRLFLTAISKLFQHGLLASATVRQHCGEMRVSVLTVGRDADQELEHSAERRVKGSYDEVVLTPCDLAQQGTMLSQRTTTTIRVFASFLWHVDMRWMLIGPCIDHYLKLAVGSTGHVVREYDNRTDRVLEHMLVTQAGAPLPPPAWMWLHSSLRYVLLTGCGMVGDPLNTLRCTVEDVAAIVSLGKSVLLTWHVDTAVYSYSAFCVCVEAAPQCLSTGCVAAMSVMFLEAAQPTWCFAVGHVDACVDLLLCASPLAMEGERVKYERFEVQPWSVAAFEETAARYGGVNLMTIITTEDTGAIAMDIAVDAFFRVAAPLLRAAISCVKLTSDGVSVLLDVCDTPCDLKSVMDGLKIPRVSMRKRMVCDVNL